MGSADQYKVRKHLSVPYHFFGQNVLIRATNGYLIALCFCSCKVVWKAVFRTGLQIIKILKNHYGLNPKQRNSVFQNVIANFQTCLCMVVWAVAILNIFPNTFTHCVSFCLDIIKIDLVLTVIRYLFTCFLRHHVFKKKIKVAI